MSHDLSGFFLFLYVDLGLKNLIIIIINTENSYDT